MSEYSIVNGPGDLPCVELSNRSGRALVSLYGAHVLSFIPAGGEEVLFLSGHSHYVYGKAIRGGIPVCWPWFGAHPDDPSLPSHGFARIRSWAPAEDCELIRRDGEEITRLVLELPRAAYPEKPLLPAVRARLIVEAGRRLRVSLVLKNLSTEEFHYSGALHTYFRVGEIAEVSVTGLEGASCLDSLTGREEPWHGPVRFSEEFDRVFYSDAACVIHDPSLGREIRVEKSGSNSTVVWNPWTAKSARMSDFGDDEFHRMLCVETAFARRDARILPPGGEAVHTAVIGVSRG